MPCAIALANWQTHKSALIAIRETVFMREQNVSAEDEWDGKDDSAVHFLVRNSEGEAIGCARILAENQGAAGCFHIGRVALLKDWRARGIGRQLMQAAIAWCQQQDPTSRILLHAQSERIGFYQRLGFAAQGNIFMDAGIPHIEMWYAC